MSSLSIAQSALTVSQRLMDLAGQNVSNANTAGYHLQVADLTEQSTAGVPVGDGVDLATINRIVDQVLEQSLNSTSSSSAGVTAQLNALQQAQTALTPGTGSLNNLLQAFFNEADQLSAKPDDPTLRQTFISSAAQLAQGFNGLASSLATLQTNVQNQEQEAVTTANNLLPQIATLNGQIQSATVGGVAPNDLLDQRDQLISQLAAIVNVQTVEEPNNQLGVIAGGMPVVTGNQSYALSLHTNTSTNTTSVVLANDANAPLALTSGQLSGLLTASNTALPTLTQHIDALAQQLIQKVNEIHATAIPLTGSFNFLGGQNSVRNANVPLAQAGLASPPQAGTLYVSVINNATGAQVRTPIKIDPATQSLQDVASALSAVPNLQGLVDPQTNTLEVIAQPGYSFNFTGQLPTAPATSNITGTATAQLGGTYSGTTNDQYNFTVVGSGTVGVTPNLTLQVSNTAGAVLGTLNIGNGYAPGTPLQTVNGVTVQLSGGTVNAGDSFSTQVVANPDTGNFLTSLGLNTFFQGTGASSIAVNSSLVANPNALALSHSGQPADGSALEQLAALQTAPVLAGATQSIQQYLSSILGATGTQVQSLTSQQSALTAATQSLQSQQQSVSGVDPNQQMIRLIQYQQSYELAAHYVTVLDTAFTALIQTT